LAERNRKRRRLEPCFQLCDPLVMALRLAVHGILQPLDEALEVRDPALQGMDKGALWIDRPGPGLRGCRGGYAANVPDSSE